MEDDRIVELLWTRSEQAIEELSSKYQRLCMQIAFGVLNDAQDAEECVNDAYLAVWNTVPPQRPNPLRAYVCRITKNLSLARYRRNSAKKRNSQYDLALDELLDVVGQTESVEEASDARELADALNAFLGTLDHRDRCLFVRRYWFSESVADLSLIFGMHAHAVSVRLFRIREKLKKHLDQRGISI